MHLSYLCELDADGILLLRRRFAVFSRHLTPERHLRASCSCSQQACVWVSKRLHKPYHARRPRRTAARRQPSSTAVLIVMGGTRHTAHGTDRCAA